MVEFLTAAEVAEHLRVTPRQVQKMVKAGRLPCVRHGRGLRFPRAAWEAFVAEQSSAALGVLKGGTSHGEAV